MNPKFINCVSWISTTYAFSSNNNSNNDNDISRLPIKHRVEDDIYTFENKNCFEESKMWDFPKN